MAAPAGGPAPGGAVILWIIPAVYLLFVAGEFMAMTQVALALTAGGRSAFEVGLLVSALWVGIFTASVLAHRLVQAIGTARCLVAGNALAVVAAGAMALQSAYLGWLLCAAVLGVAGGLVWVTGEAWLAEAAPAQRRGFFVGLFETAVGLGLMLGPALVPLARALGWPPLTVGAALVGCGFLAGLPLWWQAAPSVQDEVAGTPGTPARPDWRRIALPLVAVAGLGGLLESGSAALLPTISMRVGFGFEQAAWLGAVVGAGSALAQAPFGLVADRLGLRRTLLGAWALLVLTTVLLAAGATSRAAVDGPLLWGAGFVLGGVGGAVYTLVVIELGHRLQGGGLVRAMALLVSAYTLGTAAGPAGGGALFDALGLAGLGAVLCGLSLGGLALAWRAVPAGTPVSTP